MELRGRRRHAFRGLGAQCRARVSVVGDFNDWDGRRHPMRQRLDTGIWEVFIPGVGPGTLYKYEIVGPDGKLLPLKADPFARQSELRPKTASVVADPTPFPGPTTTTSRRAPSAIGGARRCRSTRCISAPGGARRRHAS